MLLVVFKKRSRELSYDRKSPMPYIRRKDFVLYFFFSFAGLWLTNLWLMFYVWLFDDVRRKRRPI